MSEYKSIKELVIETCMSEGAFPSYERLTPLVMRHFPTSRWKKSHYVWYKSQITRGEIEVPGFSDATDDREDDTEIEVEQSIETRVSLEKDLHSYLAGRVQEIEEGLRVVENGVECQTPAGRIDLLAEDQQGSLVVIELKAGTARDNAIGQLLGYMGAVTVSHERAAVRGVLVASGFDARVVYAAKGLPNVKLLKYRLSFNFEEVT